VDSRRRRCQRDRGRRTEPGEQRPVGSRRTRGVLRDAAVQHDGVDAIAEVEVALDDGADRVTSRTAHRQHDDPGLVPGS
jgi:hypothetical protein